MRLTEAQALHDKRGIPIAPGDVLKVFHFIGARRKRHYMYKQCLGFKGIGPNRDVPYMKFGHLNMVTDDDARDAYYLENPDGRILPDYEIVQSIQCDHEDRPRLALTSGSKPE
ncbi:hypothetical protein LB579_30410 [Mesorhizobium sp. BR1-1-7]|uniref:hypothetical protein n=1 Tax=Mesorhizobium sp. BR1-1-7 TaxID=2876647 RepID=UPI001CCD9427|nr:hypothetical protein [Mesorhizobium sp. BR1-1-7]MBZ9922007.1 hypothetical protein [Mesorhizobium sp. BR1-1-7]